MNIHEKIALKKILSYLMDGNRKAFFALYFIKANYKEWPAMIIWLKRNNIRGQKLVEFFENESKDGGGYHSGATKILSMIDGLKHRTRMVKGDELK